MKTYQVQSPIRFKGETIVSGLVQMPEAEAELLIKQGVLLEQLDRAEEKSETKPAVPTKTARKEAKS